MGSADGSTRLPDTPGEQGHLIKHDNKSRSGKVSRGLFWTTGSTIVEAAVGTWRTEYGGSPGDIRDIQPRQMADAMTD
ncbi:hypothetical protein CPLU01_06345 [Colletotrichum plurivorum]|uniref:Uncharacterized protein n=1 Tax=Colletotrichum plurivorum TaxID=2175906 RepID=A0A8H6NG23_9PEZI|nr:hypothetical protein CPLU01_06345 [Colletotrichum plurivorum]